MPQLVNFPSSLKTFDRIVVILVFFFCIMNTGMCFSLKPGFHIVVTGRWVSLTVFRSHWSIWVVGGLSGPLTVFQSLHLNCYFWRQTYSLRVVGGLSGPLAVAKGILCCFHVTQIKRQGRWRSFTVVHGR